MIKYYPFELHTHTLHSDGNFTPTDLILCAKKRGLAGIALTDHNTTSGLSVTRYLGAQNGIIVIDGIEWTTFYGHITALGKNSVDWKDLSRSTIMSNLKKAAAEGACVGIAHPFRIGYPICTGGSDDWGISDYSQFSHYEIWSYVSPAKNSTNKLAEKAYFKLIGQGAKLAVTYGLDWHSGNNPSAYAATFLGIEGEPTSDKALQAIKRGRTYVSTGIVLQEKITRVAATNTLDDVAVAIANKEKTRNLGDSTAQCNKDKEYHLGNSTAQCNKNIECHSGNSTAQCNKDKEYHLGDSIAHGDAVIKIELSYLTKEYKEAFGVEIISLSLVGTAIKEPFVKLVTAEKITLNCTLTKGYFSIIVNGKIENEQQKLLISSPYYVV